MLNSLRAGETFSSANGVALPTQGTIRGLTIFVNILYDQTPQSDPYPVSNTIWPIDTTSSINVKPPTYMQNLFDTNPSSSGQYNGIVTRLYAESSFNQLILLSDFMVVNIKQSQITPNNSGASFNRDTLRNVVIRYINNNNGLQAYYGHNNLTDYDKITSNWSEGKPKIIQPDSKIDFINFLCRNTTKTYGDLAGSSGVAHVFPGASLKINGQFYGYNTGIHAFVGIGDITEHKAPILIHEIAHLLLGDNSFHTSGGTTDNTGYENTFIGIQHGYGLFGHSILSCNAFERWRLGWRGSSNNAYPIASSNVNSDIEKFSGEKTFTLRDFVTYGDAIRIQLPYKDNTESSNQYIWLENHQSGKNNKIDGYVYPGSNGCRDMDGIGIYAYYQVGKDVLEDTQIAIVYPTNEMDNLRMLSAEGNYNVTYGDQSLFDCLGWAIRPHFSYDSPNPLSGINDQNEVYAYPASASAIQYAHKSYFGLKTKNNTLYSNLHYLGDQWDAFVPNPEIKMDISTNPAPVNAITCYSKRPGSSMTIVSTTRNTRKIYLTGQV
jgi:hypothetical protein